MANHTRRIGDRLKKILLTISLICSSLLGFSQGQSKLELESYFSAIIVKDFDVSIDWYSRVLGFEVVDKTVSEERGFKQANLSRENILLEIIELNSAVALQDAIPNYTSRTRTIGIFKTGFRVSDFDAWIIHLNNEKVDFHGDVVSDESGKRMVIVKDPDGNRVQFFEK